MIRILVIAAVASGGCLASPPSAAPGDDAPDGGRPPCGELDLFTESFDETDADARFLELWDPGEAPYAIGGGALIITGSPTEADIYSRYEYERSGGFRVDRMSLEEAGVASISIWNEEGAARILLNDTTTALYAPGDHQLELVREIEDLSFAIVFDGGQIVFRAAQGDDEWRTLTSFPDEFTKLVRLGLGVSTPSGTVEWSIGGLNTAIDCQ